MNRYSYTQNNPLKYVDPTGHQSVTGSVAVGMGGWSVNFSLMASEKGVFASTALGPGSGGAATVTYAPYGDPKEGVTISSTIQGGIAGIGAKSTLSYDVNTKGINTTEALAVGTGIGDFGQTHAVTRTIELINWGNLLNSLGINNENEKSDNKPVETKIYAAPTGANQTTPSTKGSTPDTPPPSAPDDDPDSGPGDSAV